MTNKNDTPPLTIFMLVKTTVEWLAFPVDERFRQVKEHVEPILERHRGKLAWRFFDAEFYSARVTDIWVWEVTDRHAYELTIEALRETPFWDRYFQVLDILPAVENAYAENYDRTPLAA